MDDEYDLAVDFSNELLEDRILGDLISLIEKVRTYGKEMHLEDGSKLVGKQLYVFRKRAYILLTDVHALLENTTKPTDMTQVILKRQEILLKELEYLTNLEHEILSYDQSHSLRTLNMTNLILLPPTFLTGFFAMNFETFNRTFQNWSTKKILIVFMASSLLLMFVLKHFSEKQRRDSFQKRREEMMKIR